MEYIKLKLKDKSAQDMIEFTFVLPLLIFCFVFLLTGGQLFYNKFVAFNAAYNGLRQACIENSLLNAEKEMKRVVGTYIPQTISVKDYDVEITVKDGLIATSWVKDKRITGEVIFIVQTLFPFRFTFRSGVGDNKATEFLAPNEMEVCALTSAYIEYNKVNDYTGYRTKD